MEKQPEILENGIKVYLGGDYWVLFGKSWNDKDGTRYRNASDADSLKFLIGKVLDWCIPDSEWNPLPFDKQKLIAELDAFSAYIQKTEQLRKEGKYTEVTQEVMPECFAIPTQLQVALNNAFYAALGASYKLSFLTASPSGGQVTKP
jgi:hypothetical protein